MRTLSSGIFRQCKATYSGLASQTAKTTSAIKSVGSTNVEKLPSGVTVASIEGAPTGLSRVAAVFSAGSKYEDYENRGITHLIQRAAGLATTKEMAINITRSLEQLGIGLQCRKTRDHLIYAADVRCVTASTALRAIGWISTCPEFYHWELTDTAQKLCALDCEILHRLQHDTLSVELLHKAAFRRGLGNSLFASVDKISHSPESLHAFVKSHMTADHLTIVGVNVDHQDLVDSVKHYDLSPPSGVKSPAPKFVTDEIRQPLEVPTCHSNIAWPGAASTNVSDSLLAAILSRVLGESRSDNVRWGNSHSRIGRVLADRGDVSASAFCASYADAGLLGVQIIGTGSAAGPALKQIHQEAIKLGASGVEADELTRAKAQLAGDVLMESESMKLYADSVGVHLANNKNFLSADDLASKIESITVDQVNQFAKKTFSSSGPVAMASVGNLVTIPYLDELK